MISFYDKWDIFMNELLDDIQLNRSRNIACYHYTSPIGLEGILKNKNLRFTDSTMLNDNSEGEMIFVCLDECIDDSINKMEGTIELNKEFIDAIDAFVFKRKNNYSELAKKLDSMNKNKYFVCCFSKDRDNLEMWNYYTKTNNSVGYNIKFRLNNLISELERSLLSSFEKKEIYVFKVIYDYKMQDRIINNALYICNEYWEKAKTQIEKDAILFYFYNFLELYKLAFKHQGYKNEQELRLVIKISECEFESRLKESDNLIKLNFYNGFFKPYLECGFFDKSIVDSIGVSPTIKDNHAIKSVEYLLLKYEYDKCKIIPSDIPVRY